MWEKLIMYPSTDGLDPFSPDLKLVPFLNVVWNTQALRGLSLSSSPPSSRQPIAVVWNSAAFLDFPVSTCTGKEEIY